MKKSLIVLMWLSLFQVNPFYVAAQQQNVWTFGFSAGLDFNNPGPVATTNNISSSEASASICDLNGQLLFYTNGSGVWDKNNNLMPSGNAIITDPALPPITTLTPPDYTSSSTQGALIVPVPDQPQRYYIFSLTSAEFGNSAGRLYYSIVDMSLNNGLGDVVAGQRGIFITSGLTEQMIGVVGDHCNVWLLVVDDLQNKLRSYSIDPSGIDMTPVLSPLLPINNFVILGGMSISPDRKRLAMTRQGAGLYDFDPATGQATGAVELMEPATATTAYGSCFSPDGSKLYLSFIPPLFGSTYLSYQFDLNSGDSLGIVNSGVLFTANRICSYKRGPDGKIYTESLGKINYPDLPGAACQYVPNTIPFYTGTSGGFGLPSDVPFFVRDTVNTSQEVKAPCFADHINIHAVNDSTGWDYVWNDASTGPQLNITAPGVYYVSYHGAPCRSHTDTFHVAFPGGSLPELNLSSSCFNTANGKAWIAHPVWDTALYNYDWKDAGSTTLSTTDSLLSIASGNYTVQITTASVCDTVIAFSVPIVTDSVSFSSDTLICKGDNISFVNTSANSYTTYSWDFGDGSAASPLINPAHTYTQPGVYNVTLTGTGDICTDTAMHLITVDAPLADTGMMIDRHQLCTGETIFFTTQADSTIAGLEWNFGDQTGMHTTEERIQHAYDESGIMQVTLQMHFRACPDVSIVDTVHVYPMPHVDLGPDTSICLHGDPVILSDRVPINLGDHYLWNTGDTTQSLKVKHDGTFKLKVISAQGCATTDEIVVAKGCYIDIPNAFTPDGDDVNDYFFPRQLLSDRLTAFKMQIFNRWGQIIFETNKTDGRGWDGRFNNTAQPEGVYIYLIEVTIDNLHQEQYKGNVTLIR